LPSLITWEEPYKYKPYENMPSRHTLDKEKLNIRLLDKCGGKPISTDLVPFISMKGLPKIKPYSGEENIDKYNILKYILHILVDSGLKSYGTFRDLCCKRSDTLLSTAGLALSFGFFVFACGNDVSEMKSQKKLTFWVNPDITKSRFIGEISFDNLGKYADCSVWDACGIEKAHSPFMEEVVKHSNSTIWFLSSLCGLPTSMYGNKNNVSIYGHPYPTGKGALYDLVEIIIYHFRDIGYNAYALKTNHGDYIIVITKLKILNKYIPNRERIMIDII